MLARLLPALTLATGLGGLIAAVAGGWPLWVAWAANVLIVAGGVGVEEGRYDA